MSKGLMQSLTKFGLPLGLGVVGSLSLVVWSQKPVVPTAVAAAPAPIAVTAEEAASFDPFQPTAPVQAAPAVAAAPAVTINAAEPMGPTVNGGQHMGTVSLGSNVQPMVSVTRESNSVATRTPVDFTMGAVGSDSGSNGDCVKINAQTAKITVGEAVINVLSAAKINYVK